jgi:hypothetical protein
VGDVAELEVLRDGKPMKIQATVAERDRLRPHLISTDVPSARLGTRLITFDKC